MDFIAIDVETANADMASICQIGIVRYTDGVLRDEWSSLVDPEDYFSFINIDIHGITEEDVVGAPTFSEVYDELSRLMSDTVSVSHTHFDKVSIDRAIEKHSLPGLNTIWLDSAKIARRTWPEFANKGYGLANVSRKIGYEFKHHDALEDAKASAQIILAAMEITGLDIDDWIKRVKRPIDITKSSAASDISREGNTEGDLYGEVVVFTGTLEIPRREAADLASQAGCEVAAGVTKKTTLLVVGDQDISKFATGADKSSKHLKAEKLILKGQNLRIIQESDFRELVANAV